MESASPVTASPVSAARRWPLFLLGVLLFFAGPVLYAVEVWIGRLAMPWYLPILATVGVLFMIASVWQRGGILRISGLVLFGLLCGAVWFFVLIASRTPDYVGPAQPGKKVPAFMTKLADGKTFTQHDLEAGNRSVLLFFRGRW